MIKQIFSDSIISDFHETYKLKNKVCNDKIVFVINRLYGHMDNKEIKEVANKIGTDLKTEIKTSIFLF